jgi:hypothetical protein
MWRSRLSPSDGVLIEAEVDSSTDRLPECASHRTGVDVSNGVDEEA